jgi:hypothetical protein
MKDPQWRNSGQTLTEYLILLLLVAIVGLTAVKQFGRAVHQRIDKARDEIQKL